MLATPGESLVSRHPVALLALLAAVLAYVPLIALRYDFHDSWALLYVVNAARVYNFALGCLETYEHSYLIGRPFYPATICALTAFGPVVDLLWVPKLASFAAWLAALGIFAAELRRAGAGLFVAGLCALSILFLPGTLLIVSQIALSPIAMGVVPAALAGYAWVRRLRRPAGTRRGRAAWFAAALVLLIVSMAFYQIVAVLFFVPVLIVLLFAPMQEGRRTFGFALGAVLLFGVAAALYLAVHYWLLYAHHYFFLVPEQVAGISSTSRSATLHLGLGHVLGKIGYLGRMLPEIAALWFVSEWSGQFLPAVIAVAAALAAAGFMLMSRREGGLWRFAAVAMVCGAFFAPYLVSDNAGNVHYSQQRILVFWQIPVVVLLCWLVHRLIAGRPRWSSAAAAAAGAVAFAGGLAAYLLVVRSFVIPNYMELKHVEYRVRDAFRRNLQHIYIIQPDRAHLRATLGTHGRSEFASITTAHNPLHMVTAILTELEQKRPIRSVIPVPFEKGSTIMPAADRLILDMRYFP